MQQKLTVESMTPTRENIEDTDYAPNTSLLLKKHYKIVKSVDLPIVIRVEDKAFKKVRLPSQCTQC